MLLTVIFFPHLASFHRNIQHCRDVVEGNMESLVEVYLSGCKDVCVPPDLAIVEQVIVTDEGPIRSFD